MSTNIYEYNGTLLVTIADGTLNTTASPLGLPGKGYTNYGAPVLQDIVWTMTNFAGSVAPTPLLQGVLWYNTSSNALQIYTGSVWSTLLKDNQDNLPAVTLTYDLGSTSLRWNNVWAGTINATTVNAGTITGDNTLFHTNQTNLPTVNNLYDLGSPSYQFNNVYANTVHAGTISGATNLFYTTQTNTPTVTLTYDLGSALLQFNNVYSSKFVGNIQSTANNTLTFTTASTEAMRINTNGNVGISTTNIVTGFESAAPMNMFTGRVGIGTSANSYPLSSNVIAVFGNHMQYGNIVIQNATQGGTGIYFADGTFQTSAAGSVANVMYKNATNLPTATATYDLGSASFLWSNIYATTFHGTATQAQYADVAERYAADAEMEMGDVVRIGGSAEITKTTEDCDTFVFGVISDKPALQMNSKAGNDATHPYVALIGRTPCKVIGPVGKGCRLVSSDTPGVARAADSGENPLCIIGRALADKTTADIGLVEIAIGRA